LGSVLPQYAPMIPTLFREPFHRDGWIYEEVAIFDQQLRSRFELLQRSGPDIVATPPVYITFDLLYRDGVDLSPRSLRWRRSRLEELVTGGELVLPELVLPVRRLPSNGLEAWAAVLERGYEGYVAKDEASPYRGGVTRSWLKVKVCQAGPIRKTAGGDG
jgi:bifunctional non-homologous end joining protein LigD